MINFAADFIMTKVLLIIKLDSTGLIIRSRIGQHFVTVGGLKLKIPAAKINRENMRGTTFCGR